MCRHLSIGSSQFCMITLACPEGGDLSQRSGGTVIAKERAAESTRTSSIAQLEVRTTAPYLQSLSVGDIHQIEVPSYAISTKNKSRFSTVHAVQVLSSFVVG